MVICQDCGKREAKITFADSVLSYTHGFGREICRQCYIALIEDNIKNAQKNLKIQKKLMEQGK